MQDYSNLIEIAKTIEESDGKYDRDICKMAILFPLLESLGYDATKPGDIVLNPLYADSGEYKVDYGLRGSEEDSLKTVIKVIEYNAEPGLEFENLRKCIIANREIEYLIITDCFNYYIYALDLSGITFTDVVSFSICDPKKDHLKTLNLLNNPAVKHRQDYAINEDDVEDNNPSEEIVPSRSASNEKTSNLQNSKKRKTNSSIVKTIMPIIVGSICIVILITAFFAGLMERNNIDRWNKSVFQYDYHKFQYYSIEGNVNVSTYIDKTYLIHVSISDVIYPPNTNITLLIYPEGSDQVLRRNVLTNDSGVVSCDVELPVSWKNVNICVEASMLFDTNQTLSAMEKYGDFGEKIVSISNTRSFIGLGSVYYDHDTIEKYIEDKRTQEEAERLAAIKAFFEKYTVVKYSNGDMCFYPKGYDTDDWGSANNNITSTNKSYAKIYYDAKTGKGKLYYVIGTYMKSPSWPAGVFTLSDSVNTYTLSVNDGLWHYHFNRFESITGWSQYDETGVANLVSILSNIYNSERSTIEFKDLNERIYISDQDKLAVLGIIDLYKEYFANGVVYINPDWID